jgi:hypothetical protein
VGLQVRFGFDSGYGRGNGVRKEIDIDLREQMKNIEMKVQRDWGYKLNLKNKVWVYLGLKLIKVGCYLCGINFQAEE